jgi:hypothetical protein
VILDVLGWLAAADAVAALAIAGAIYLIGRRSKHPVPVGTAAGIAVFLTLPVVLLYFAAWMWVRAG